MRYSLNHVIGNMFKSKDLYLLLKILEINMIKNYLIKVWMLVKNMVKNMVTNY